MKLIIGLFLIVSAIAAAWSLKGHSATKKVGDQPSTAMVNGTGPVVVELFTSEGCSSCPPADSLLSRLDQQPIKGVEIIALSEHVDYWNKLGWRDPFSSIDFSNRQNDYADAFGQDSVYTPQMVVDGQLEFVGSYENKAHEAIIRAAKAAKAKVELKNATNSGSNMSELQLSVSVNDLPQIARGDGAEVMLAITENDLSSQVSRGENAGHSLKHTAVVRQLTSLGRLNSEQKSFSAQPKVTLSNEWQRANLHAVVFVQERRSRHILGAATIGLGR